VAFAIMTMRNDWPAPVAISCAIALGAVCGLLNGLMVARLRLQPFIATLAMMAFARGLAKSDLLSRGAKVQLMPAPSVVEFLNTRVPILGADVSIGVFVFLGCFLLTLILLQRLRFGRYVYAIGDNVEAAWLSGVPVKRTLILAYTLCGLFAGVAGVMFTAMERQGNPDGGMGYELTAIAMVVLGGTSLAGGRGGVTLTLLGALTIGYLRKILDLNGVATAEQLMITGGIIVLAVLLQSLRRK
jgi:ribose/xylose/arabinose/galactoside ABC-type transport system permease subunit